MLLPIHDQEFNLSHQNLVVDTSQLRTTRFIDDPSLSTPSSTIHFQNDEKISHVYPYPEGQFIIEEGQDMTGTRTLTAKRFRTATIAEKALRATYTLVTIFWVGRHTCFDMIT